ncbi:hypothetical protein FRC03_005976 [Tulasnella sp. 419]|nr:hypothetical protein FRC03_005976 [Tulasnella sp. 419]
MPSLDQIPYDILYQIADFILIDSPQGPPETVFASLLVTSKAIHYATSVALKVLAFRAQFDTAAIRRRFPSSSTPSTFASELERRWRSLKRIRWAGSDPSLWGNEYTSQQIQNDLWQAFFLLLENDGKNWAQLVEWAQLRVYIRVFLQYDMIPACSNGELPQETEERSLAMWILWLLINDSGPGAGVEHDPELINIVIAIAFASYAYATEALPWYIFRIIDAMGISPLNHQVPRTLTPIPQYNRISSVSSYLMQPICISVPLISEAALHLYYGRSAQPQSSPSRLTISASEGDEDSMFSNSRRYDKEWFKLTSMWNPLSVQDMPRPGYRHVNGSVSGTYEGMFVLPEIGVSRSLAEGALPIPTFEEAFMTHHFQTWRFDENIFQRQNSSSYSHALLPGPALNAHLPEDIVILTRQDGLEVYSPQGGSYFYKKWPTNLDSNNIHATTASTEDMSPAGSQERVNVIITGQAIDYIQAPMRSNNMMPPLSTAKGTIRHDGQITLLATSADWGGKWLYTGRLYADGVWRGRWRALVDNLTGVAWEGLFELRPV